MRPLPNLLLTSNIKYRWRQAVCPTDLTPNQLLPENINDLFLLCGGGFRSCARQRNRSCSFLNRDRCKGGTQNEYLHILFFYNASVNSTCAQPPPPAPGLLRGICPPCQSLGVGYLQILRCPGAGHLPTPEPFPSFWHTRGFLSEYNYTEGFTRKKAYWLICQGQG